MPVDPADKKVRLAISDILSNFLSEYAWEDGPLATLRDKVYGVYRPNHIDAFGLRGLADGNSELGLRSQHRFLFLEPVVDKTILPLLTLETSDQWVHFRLYVLLTMLDQGTTLQAFAIRFETDEGGPDSAGMLGSHDFCHAQFCMSINSTTPSTISWLPESQPSFPLDAADQVGLILCMLTTLYGGRHVFERLNATGDNALRQHLKKVRAFGSTP